MPVQPVRHISVAISRPVEEVYAFLAEPENMPRWASGLGRSLRHLVDTFFDGSAEQVVAAVLGGEAARLSQEDLERIADLVAKARKENAR